MSVQNSDGRRWHLSRDEADKLTRRRYSGCLSISSILEVVPTDSYPGLVSVYEGLRLAQGVLSMATGSIEGAILSLEGLLPLDTANRDKYWCSCVLLGAAIARIYSCDPDIALIHTETALKLSPKEGLGDLLLVKAVAQRLSGDVKSALETFRELENGWPGGTTWNRMFVHDWYFEAASIIGNTEIGPDIIARVTDEAEFPEISGLPAAALYRAAISGLTAVKQKPDDLLSLLNNAPSVERPLLNMLLEDILPRPLEGVEIVSDLSDESQNKLR